jgi:hypothetical protein
MRHDRSILPTVRSTGVSDSRPIREEAMSRRPDFAAVFAVVGTALFAPLPFQGGDLARRITSAPDGLVKMTYASRDGICGDGRNFIADSRAGAGYDVWFSEGMSFSGPAPDFAAKCVAGPVRLLLVVRDHAVVDVQPFVGPSSPATERAGTEIGTVSVIAISKYLLDLAAHSREDVSRTAMLAASVADSVRVAGQLATMARDRLLPTSVREGAVRWTNRTGKREGNRDALRAIRSIAEDQEDQISVRERAIRVVAEDDDGSTYLRALYPRLQDASLRERIVRVVAEHGAKNDMDWVRTVALDKSERTSIREQAVKALAEDNDSRGLRALYDRLDDPALRERVVRSMAEIGDGDSKRWLRDLAQRQSESVAVRDRAIRSLGEQGDLAFLERAYGSIDDTSLRERIIRVMAEAGGTETMTWLRGIARDSKESSGLRERAVRSIAEGGAPTSDLVSLYDSISDRSIRDRLVNIFADRGDKTAREKLRSIATGDPDEDLRRRATRKLTDSR